MKKQTKILLSIVGVLAVAAVVLASSNSGLFQGRMMGRTNPPPLSTTTADFLNADVTRAYFYNQVATVLTHHNGGENISGYTNCFTDTNGNYYENSICYMKAKGYVTGDKNVNFGPVSSLSRAQAVKILSTIYSELKGPSSMSTKTYDSPAYQDVTANDWPYNYVQHAAYVKIITSPKPWGSPLNYFYPDMSITNDRAQEMINNLDVSLSK